VSQPFGGNFVSTALLMVPILKVIAVATYTSSLLIDSLCLLCWYHSTWLLGIPYVCPYAN